MSAGTIAESSFCPKLREDLRPVRQSFSGETVYLLEDTDHGRFCHFRELEYEIFKLCDGRNNSEEIRQIVNERHQLSLSLGNLYRFIDKLDQLQLLENSNQLSPQTGRLSTNQILHKRWSIFDPDRMLTWLQKPLAFLFTFEFVLVSCLVILSGTLLAISNTTKISTAVQHLASIEYLFPLLMVTLVIAFVHELSHGLTCKRFGGDVHEIGMLLIYFMPAFYCNVSSAWRFSSKRKRMLVTFAGPWSSLLIWSLATIVWRFALPGSSVNTTALLFMAVTGIECLFNLNPLIKLDGYYLLSDWFECPNLRQRSFEYLKQRVLKINSNALSDRPGQNGLLFLTYGVLASVYSVALVLIFICVGGAYLMSEFKLFGVFAVLILLAVVFRNGIGSAVIWPLRVMATRFGRPLKVPRSIITAMFAGFPLIGFCAYPWEITVVSDVKVCASRSASISAKVDGTICRVFAAEGDIVESGAPLFQLENDELECQLEQTQAELDQTNAKLQLLQNGASQEEIELGQARVEIAKQEYQSACQRLKVAQSVKDEELKEIQAEEHQAQLSFDHAQLKLDRMASLQKNQAISTSELESAQSDVKLFEAKLRQQQARFRKINADNLTDLKENVSLTKLSLATANREFNLLTSNPRPERLSELQSQIERLQARQSYLKCQSEQAFSKSPFCGTITTKNLQEKIDRQVKRGEVVVEVQNIEQVRIELLVQENEIGAIETGQTVAFKASAYPNQEFIGIVQTIAPAAIETNQNGGQATYVVCTSIDNQDRLLKPGMTGKTKIFTGRRYWGSLIGNQITKTMKMEVWSWLPSF